MPSVQAYTDGRSIRTQLNLLVLAAVLPLLLAFAYEIHIEARSGFERARAEAQQLARVASADAQGYFARAEQRLGDISRRVEVGNLDPARCKSLFADIETIRPRVCGPGHGGSGSKIGVPCRRCAGSGSRRPDRGPPPCWPWPRASPGCLSVRRSRAVPTGNGCSPWLIRCAAATGAPPAW